IRRSWKSTTQKVPSHPGGSTRSHSVVCELTVAPKGKRAAVINHRNQVLVIELETEQVTVVEDNPYGRPQGLAWSPDGTWLAYASHFSRQTIGLKLWRS